MYNYEGKGGISMENWNRDFHNISIIYEDKMVRIKSDEALNKFLLSSQGPNALAEHILKNYETIFHKNLKIHIHSLAVEVIAHVFIDTLSKDIGIISDKISHDKLELVQNVLESIRKHTRIIDCGESSVDNNRFVWDMLEPFHSVLYGIVGLAACSIDHHEHKNHHQLG